MSSPHTRIWIDLENTPHIPFFAPIIRELRKNGHDVVVTARDAYQTCQMADLYGFQYRAIGRHYGRRMAFKAAGLAIRTLQLVPFALRQRPLLAVSHGSRSQILAAKLLGIPSIALEDYEHSRGVGFGGPNWLIAPRALASAEIPDTRPDTTRFYSGIKEDVYAPEFVPNDELLRTFSIDPRRHVLVTVRPPATEAHYHNAESEELLARFMARALAEGEVRIVLLPRNSAQDRELRKRYAAWFATGRVTIPGGVVPGLNLLWHSDLVVSGGGTMNREAAALGVPVYSIFRGQIGAVDRQLCTERRLVLVSSPQQIDEIPLRRRTRDAGRKLASPALFEVVQHIENIFSLSRGRWQLANA